MDEMLTPEKPTFPADRVSKNGDGLDTFRKWLTPILITGIGLLVRDKMISIDNKLALVPSLQLEQALMTREVEKVKDDQKEMKIEFKGFQNDFEDHKQFTDDELYQKAEMNIKKGRSTK